MKIEDCYNVGRTHCPETQPCYGKNRHLQRQLSRWKGPQRWIYRAKERTVKAKQIQAFGITVASSGGNSKLDDPFRG